MPDNLKRRHPEDPQKVNVHQEWEVGYWSEKLGCTRGQLTDAVEQIGPMVSDVKKHLEKSKPL